MSYIKARKRNKTQTWALWFFSPSSHLMGLRRQLSHLLPHTMFLWLHSIYFSSIYKWLQHFCLDQKLSVHFLCLNTEIIMPCAPRLTIWEVQDFKCLRNWFRLFRKVWCWLLPKKHSRELQSWQSWSVQPLYTFLLMPILNCPCHYYTRFLGVFFFFKETCRICSKYIKALCVMVEIPVAKIKLVHQKLSSSCFGCRLPRLMEVFLVCLEMLGDY